MNYKNNNNCTGLGTHGVQAASLAVAVALASMPAWSGETIEFDNGATIDWSVTTSYGLGVRVGKPSDRLMGINADDANRNFNQGSLTTNRIGALGEMILRKDNYGAVVRASTFYDDVYHQGNDNDSPQTVNKDGRNDEFTSRTKYYSGGRTRLLDAYVFGGWRFENDTMLDAKAGRHIESWGESLYYPGVNGVQNPSDAVKAAQPGVEVKEILLPVGQFSASYRINPQITFGAYVQYEWKGTELPPVGSYLSGSDVIGPGREFIRTANGNVRYQGTDEPRDDGQWGVQVRYRPVPAIELSLFHVNYHDKNPATALVGYNAVPLGNGQFAFATNGYRVEYFEDIKLTGLSMSTKLGDTQIGAEWSYRDGAPVMVNTGLGPVPAKGKGQQIQLSAMRILGDRPWASQTTLTAEIIHVRADSVDSASAAPNLQGVNLLPSLAPMVGESDDYTYKTSSAWRSKDSSAYTVGASFSYPGVFQGWDLEVPLRFSNVFSGASPMAGSIAGVQGDRRYSVGTTFKYLSNLEVALTMIGYLGSPDPVKRPMADRDYATFSMKYTF
ncbi:DUF1302 family protein [Pseudomonas sp. JQ170]|uniref:DUF1302 domain-containing protein n=1 Tax=unclassified Pseudomonas TaxID=196821 RepID=UPI002651C86D|nr:MULTISPECIES: DUF1302 family protein [unclassified Pseudomonas]MDN7141354.1 DUF1302 family protein [Pseudomonas sp. JQ170]WRO78070.1 DUF1302 family protein [Pseudomonas sp. 170C]